MTAELAHSTTELVVYLYGAFGGWLGIAAAYYLQRIQDPPADWQTVLAFFAAGSSLLLLSVSLLLVVDSDTLLAIRVIAYTIFMLAELVAFVRVLMCTETGVDHFKEFLRHPRFKRDSD